MGLKVKILKFKEEFMNLPKIIRFRLIGMGFVIFAFAITIPLLKELGGIYLKYNEFTPATIFSLVSFLTFIFGLLNSFVLKNFNLSALFKIVIIYHFVLILTTSIYFINKTTMIFIDTFLGIFDYLLLNAFSISFNNLVNYFYRDSYQSYQNIKQIITIWASVTGALFSMFLNYAFPPGGAIFVFITLNIFFTIYLFQNQNIYRKFDRKYMFRYLRKLLKK